MYIYGRDFETFSSGITLMNDEYLPRRMYLRVRELLAEKCSTHQVALLVPLSPATIDQIAADQILPSRIVVEEDDPQRDEALTAQRCAGCGALVYAWPCLGCQMTRGETVSRPRVGGLRLKYKQRRIHRRAA